MSYFVSAELAVADQLVWLVPILVSAVAVSFAGANSMPTDIRVVQPTKTMFMLGALLWSGAGFASPFLLPAQDTPNFFNAKMCRDRQVLSALKTAATNILKTKVIVAAGDGPKWSGYQPDDIHLEAVSILSKDKSAIFCSVTITAKGITERVVYVVGPTGTPGSYGDSWIVKFGGDLGPYGGGHRLFPGMIEVEPSDGL